MALIMLADDTPEIILLLTDLLESRGHQVVSVNDGVAMIEKAKAWRPHVIIADLMMPGAYGSAAYKTLQDEPRTKDIPVIFLTAVPEFQARRIVPPEGPRLKLLFKPVMPKPLFDAINEMVKLSLPTAGAPPQPASAPPGTAPQPPGAAPPPPGAASGS